MELGIDPLAILRLKLLEKIAVGLGILALIAVGYWYFWVSGVEGRVETIEVLENNIRQNDDQIATKRRKLLKKRQLEVELALLEEKEASAMQELPSSKEIPALLTDISRAGHEQGLEFLLFAPQGEAPRDFYAEVPVNLRVQGTYHEFARFVDQVAHMSRIVTLGDLVFTPESGNRLAIQARATTYRFLDPEEAAAHQRGRRPRK